MNYYEYLILYFYFVRKLLILSQIIFITIILTADNAIIIGVISANFIPKIKANNLLGVTGALIFKIIFALFATYLFKLFYKKISWSTFNLDSE